MNLGARKNDRARRKQGRGDCEAFTLAEVLAAMLFMAIVIPVAMQALRVASLAGTVADRKAQATRLAELVLNEALISTNTVLTTQSGTVKEGLREFRYYIRTEPWSQHLTNTMPQQATSPGEMMVSQPEPDQLAVSQISMNLVTVEVLYNVQEKEYSVTLDTLVESE
jgi:type II secretory pathway pseudopilin PulG